MQKFIIKITSEDFSLLSQENLECFILSATLDKKFFDDFAEKAQKLGRLVLSENEQLCLDKNLDGLILDLSKSENIAQEFRLKTGNLKKKIIGVICRNRRHEAMLVSECEPDFVVFKAWKDGLDKVYELTKWYNDMFLLQSALLPLDDDLDFTIFKTDFVILSDLKYKIFVAKK